MINKITPMSSADEFSFPTMADDAPHFASSPPLWRIPSELSLDSCHEEDDDEEVEVEGCKVQRLWYSSLGSKLKRTTDEEEKMDILWENFNDEVHRISSFGRRSKAVVKSSRAEYYDSDEHGTMAELCCVQALNMPRRGSSTMFSTRRPSFLVILKVFKKLFLLQNSHCPKKTKSALL